jgi:hypothetical protein
LGDLESSFSGIRCWDADYDRQAGVLLQFGEKVRKRKPTLNPHLSEERQHFHGTHRILILCHWRLIDSSGMQVDDDRSGSAVRMIEGKDIQKLRIDRKTNQLKIDFVNGLRLLVHDKEDSSDDNNYSITVEDVSWIFSSDRAPRLEVN